MHKSKRKPPLRYSFVIVARSSSISPPLMTARLKFTRMSRMKKQSSAVSMGNVGIPTQSSSNQWKAIIGGVTIAVYTRNKAVARAPPHKRRQIHRTGAVQHVTTTQLSAGCSCSCGKADARFNAALLRDACCCISNLWLRAM